VLVQRYMPGIRSAITSSDMENDLRVVTDIRHGTLCLHVHRIRSEKPISPGSSVQEKQSAEHGVQC
jgi:hypothetical protein